MQCLNCEKITRAVENWWRRQGVEFGEGVPRPQDGSPGVSSPGKILKFETQFGAIWSIFATNWRRVHLADWAPQSPIWRRHCWKLLSQTRPLATAGLSQYTNQRI